MASLSSIFDDRAGNTLALLGDRLVLQYRNAPLTHGLLDTAEAFLVRWQARLSDGKPFGCVAVINGDAGVTSEALRDRQRVFIGSLLKAPGAAMVTVILGETVQASAMRSMGRLLVMGQKNLVHTLSVPEAAARMASHCDEHPASAIEDAFARIIKGDVLPGWERR